MGVIVNFPIQQDEHVKAYQKILNENSRSDPNIDALLDYVARMEKILAQSNKNISEMQNQLSELKEIQKHPIKAELNNIVCSIQQNADAAKSWLEKLKESIIQWCKSMVEKVKDMGVSALDKAASTLKIQNCLEGIAKCAAKENDLSGKAIKDMENFATEYHKAGRAISNMGRALIGKEPIDGAKQNGKLLKIMSAPHRANKSLAAKIERTTYRMAKSLDDFHTQEQIKRLDRQETKTAKLPNQAGKRTPDADFARMKAKQGEMAASKPKMPQRRLAAAGIEG